MASEPITDRKEVSKPKIDIGVACSGSQAFQWWTALVLMIMYEIQENDQVQFNAIRAVGSALPDFNKNAVIGNQVKRLSLTDKNRTSVTKGFLDGGADYLFWMDDDTVPPKTTISHLVRSGRDFISGIYYYPTPPHNPIAYKREASGLYAPIFGYPEGAVMQVDSVGMGCTLIHRSVYEKIEAEHMVFQRLNGSISPIHKSKVRSLASGEQSKESYVEDGIWHEPYKFIDLHAEGEDRNFPFYQLEYNRTEDHYFCELADSVGIKPWVDTAITCDHWKLKPTSHKEYKATVNELEGII